MEQQSPEDFERWAAPEDRLAAPKQFHQYFLGVADWLRKHWAEGEDQECPYCKDEGRKWIISGPLGLNSAPGWPQQEAGGGITPMVPISCAHCGQTVFIPALLIFEPQSPPAEESEK